MTDLIGGSTMTTPLNRAALTAVGAAVAAIVTVPPAAAQGAAAGDGLALQEIVVTARKREESLQDVPLTVTAVSGAAIEQLGIRDSRDLALYVPGFSNVASFGRNSSERPTIRGQSNILGAPNASYFVDGVYLSGSATNTETANLERIEVIKGPQAALYGRATFAGAINYVTKRPSKEFEGSVSATAADFEQRDVSGWVSGPVVDGQLYFYLAATHNEIGGFYDNPLDQRDDLGAERTDAVTAKLLWTPNDSLEMTGLLSWSEDDDAPPALGLQSRTFNNCQLADPVLRPRSRGYYCGVARPIQDLSVKQLTAQMPNPGNQRERTRAALTASLDFGDGYQLVSTSAYSEEDYEVQIDVSYGGYVVGRLSPTDVPVAASPLAAQFSNDGAFQRINGERRADFSQELRLSSPADRALRWSLGGYYFSADDDFIRDDKIYPNGGLIVPNGTASLTYRDISNTAWFASLEYDFTEQLTLTAEVRQAEEEVDQQSYAFPTNGTARTASAPLAASFKSTTPRVTARYKWNDDLTLFANYAEGTKPGGFNSGTAIQLLIAQGLPVEIKEEKSEVVEIGAKFNLGSRVTGSITAYDISLVNQQLTQNIVGAVGNSVIATSFVENSGKTSSRGIELEMTARLATGFDVSVGGSLIDATFDQYINADQATLYSNRTTANLTAISATNPTGCGTLGGSAAANAAACAALVALDNAQFGNVAGQRTPRSPKWNAYVVTRYTRPLTETMSLVVGVDVTAEGSKFAQVHNLIETGSRRYLNARIGLETDTWNVALWGRNLNDDDTALDILRYIDGQGIPSYFGGFATRGFAISLPRPRQVGLTASYKF
jgi:outer membrane receptor protein involved in Fe transport